MIDDCGFGIVLMSVRDEDGDSVPSCAADVADGERRYLAAAAAMRAKLLVTPGSGG